MTNISSAPTSSPDLDDALRRFHETLAAAADEPAGTLATALVLTAAGQWSVASRRLDRLLAQPDPPLADLARFAQALCRRFLGQPAAALALLQPMVERHPDMLAIHLQIGLALLALDRLAEAQTHLEAAMQRFAQVPERVLLLADLCIVLQRSGQPQQGLMLCDQALAQPDLDQPVVHANRGAFLIALQRDDEARAALDCALQRQPELSHALANRGYLELRAGRPAEARPYLQKALTLEPQLAATCRNWWQHLCPGDEVPW